MTTSPAATSSSAARKTIIDRSAQAKKDMNNSKVTALPELEAVIDAAEILRREVRASSDPLRTLQVSPAEACQERHILLAQLDSVIEQASRLDQVVRDAAGDAAPPIRECYGVIE